MTEYWGYHLTVDCCGCSIEAITTKENVENFARELVKRIDMKAYGEPQVPHFASHDPDKGGFTLVQLIETSAITGHFVDSTGEAYIDIFSCKPFDSSIAVETIKEFFQPTNYSKNFFFRKAPPSTRKFSINGDEFNTCAPSLSYEDIRAMAGQQGHPTMVWGVRDPNYTGKRSGVLIIGQNVDVVDGMYFSVVHTTNA